MLQKIALLCTAAIFVLASCNNTPSNAPVETSDAVQLVDGHQYFGEKINPDGAVSIEHLVSTVAASDASMKGMMKTTGEVEAVCKKKGCWMTLKKPDGETMRVTFKDYGFFMPTDIEGKTVIVEGEAKMDTTTVDDLRHYAEDEGLSQEEIDKITEPEVDVSFVAHGVILKDE